MSLPQSIRFTLILSLPKVVIGHGVSVSPLNALEPTLNDKLRGVLEEGPTTHRRSDDSIEQHWVCRLNTNQVMQLELNQLSFELGNSNGQLYLAAPLLARLMLDPILRQRISEPPHHDVCGGQWRVLYHLRWANGERLTVPFLGHTITLLRLE